MQEMNNTTGWCDFGDISFDSATGRVLFISNSEGLYQLFEMDPTTQRIQQVSFFAQHVKCFWLLNTLQHRIMVALDDYGNECEQLFTLNYQGDFDAWVVDEDAYHYFGGVFAKGGGFYSRNYRGKDRFEFCRRDAHEKETKVLFSTIQPLTSLKKLSDNTIFLLFEVTNIDRAVAVLDVTQCSLNEVPSLQGRIAQVEVVDADTVLLLADLGEQWLALYEYQISVGTRHLLASVAGQDIISFCYHPETAGVVYEIYDQGVSLLCWINRKRPEQRCLIKQHNMVIDSMVFADAETLVMSISNAVIPPSIIALNIIDGFSKPIVKQKLRHVSSARCIHDYYTSFDGLVLSYYAMVPEAPSSDVVIYLHGGPENQARSTFSPLLFQLVESGVTVLVPNIRGSAGYGRNFIALDDVYQRCDALKDVIYLHRHAINHHRFDRRKISLLGHSYGGFMTLMAITHYPDLWRCAVDIVGMSHLGEFLSSTPEWRRKLREFEYGESGKCDDFFDAISPLNRVREVCCPVLVLHGTHDARVPFSESAQFVKAMTAHGKSVRFLKVENEGHFFLHRQQIASVCNAVTEFLTNQPESAVPLTMK